MRRGSRPVVRAGGTIVRNSTPSSPRLFPLLPPHWLKTGESICVIVGVILLIFQSFLQWQQLEGFREQLQLQRTDVMALREALARDTYSRSTDTSLRLADALLEHPDIRSALHPADPLSCLPVTLQRSYQYLVMNLELIASLWGYYQRGAITGEEWASWERWFQHTVVGSWLFPALWARERDYYFPTYRDYVDRQLATAAAARDSSAPTPPPDLTTLAATYAAPDPPGTPPACATLTPTMSDVPPPE